MMRVNLKTSLVMVCVLVMLVTLSIWTRCGGTLSSLTGRHHQLAKANLMRNGERTVGDTTGSFEELDCSINGEYTVGCRREGEEVYLPFSFLHKYFEVYGKLASYDGYERFEWSHSYANVYYPKAKYDPRGVYMYFENYNVEVRDRVKCVSASEGVPVSIQWESQGYYYPTQIAQFGLSHYSKNLTEPEPRRKVLEDGSSEKSSWIVPVGASLARTYDAEIYSHVLHFQTAGKGIQLKLDHVLDFVLSVQMQLSVVDNSSLTVVVQHREKKEFWNLHYTCSNQLIHAKDEDVYHGMNCGEKVQWRSLTRDLFVDLQKGLVLQNKEKRKISRSKFKISAITLTGSGQLDNLTLSTSEHLAHFYAAARWFVSNQDAKTGGWANTVKRRGAPGMLDLLPGWYSAMGQGHGISVLARAYHLSGDKTYLDAAVQALHPFKVLRLKVMEKRNMLMVEGMKSLKSLLLSFDTGSGTIYDLRHLTVGSAPKIARWDYHATHVNQLLLLATLDQDPLFATTAGRWVGYMNGKRAPHN
ncbi:D-glucuronyl C5-epimerase B [Nilaparvata lugens]|uniref:D-glucuronyl C5-epimerase B n=1 Tax=Nilaparvata lugens TaxID=108931 RepID=UPI00193D28FA|nr:D-glucuronyl C5-epimerase B [Nilaparvata lugens]